MARARRRIQCFEPIADRRARLLILGSMPGIASLAAAQYYAHPRNAFWPMLEAVWGIPAAAPYAQRVRAVKEARIAIWDVLASCHRPTSLDSDIEPGSIITNDFAGFFAAHPGIELVAFNGGTAAALFRRHVLPGLPAPYRELEMRQMPSTSPAHARLRLADKQRAWSELARSLA
jgi:double-stranded uracil-DNA glycosylase